MSNTLFPLSRQQFFANNGTPLANGWVTTYAAGTTTPQASYNASGGVNPNPCQLDFRGSMDLWGALGATYKILVTDSAGNTIPGFPVDNVIVGQTLSQVTIGQTLYPQSATELARSVTPTYYWHPYGSFLRYGADPTGASDSSVAIISAMECNSDVFDDYPGGGNYLIYSEMVIPSYPITIRGQARTVVGDQVNVTGTVFTLATVAGASAACISSSAFIAGLRIQNIGFRFQTNTTGQIALHFRDDVRFSIIEGCAFTGGGVGSTTIGIQFDGGGVFSGGDIIRDNYFSSGLSIGIYLKGTCTTIKLVNNELYGYGGAGSTAGGYGIECDYPVVEPLIIGNYFEGWVAGVYSDGASNIRQIGNDYEGCTNSFNWVQTSYTTIDNQSIGETGNAGIYSGQSSLDASKIQMVGGLGAVATGGAVQSTRGFQEGSGSGTNLRAFSLGYCTTPSFSAGNFTGSSSMTWTVASAATYAYTVVGKTMTVFFDVGGTVAGTPSTALQIAIPAGFTAASTVVNPIAILNNATWSISIAQVTAAATIIQAYITASGSGNWTAGTANLVGQISFPVD